MRETFHLIVMRCCLGGLFVLSAALVLSVFIPWLARKTTVAFRQWCRLGLVGMLLSGLFTTGMVLYGSIKAGGTNAAPSRTQRRLSPAAPQMERAENWYRRGAWDDGRILSFADGWCFPHGTNHYGELELRAQGLLYATEKSEDPIVSLTTPLALAPYETEVRCGHTADNAYRIEWHDAHPNRASNQTADASIVLHRNGDIKITENGVTTNIVRELPFAHDGYGQDESWVRSNLARLQELSPSLTNAEQILSVGYTAWAEDQVGIGLTNGLYLFTASFPEDPPETTQLYIGDYTVAVTNAGTYTFVLGKGTDYEFGTWPHIENVDYYLQDDLSESAELITPYWWGEGAPGEWTLDGGWSWLYTPSVYNENYYPGYCCMMPTLQGAPDVSHLGATDFPMTFEANLVDHPRPERVSYHWSSPDECLEIRNPTARTTEVSARSVPGYDRLQLSVTTDVGGRTLSSSLGATYGTNDYPGVAIKLTVPKVIFVNDDFRGTRYYPVACSVYSPVDTNVVVTLRHEGETLAMFSPSGNHAGTYEMNRPRSLSLSAGGEHPVDSFDFMCMETGRGTFVAEVRTVDGTLVNVVAQGYNCIEPIQRLVTDEKGPDGRLVNPSRLVYGTNAYFKVGVKGDYPGSDVNWSCSGPVMLSATNGFMVAATPTATNGIVTLEAKFGNDARHHPRFVLPIVRPRNYELQLVYVKNQEGRTPKGVSSLNRKLKVANDIFSQVGISFSFADTPIALTNAQYAVLREREHVASENGKTPRPKLSQQAESLFALASSPGRLRIFVVHKIIDSEGPAFSSQWYKALVVTEQGSDIVLAHELGHLLGLLDIYTVKEMDVGEYPIPEYSSHPYDEMFMDRSRDWGEEAGRLFYGDSDSCSSIIEKLLMYGHDRMVADDRVVHLRDIPSGAVEGFHKQSNAPDDVLYVDVGASTIEWKESGK